ncbi:hypothetical protein ACL02U_06300 [Streptomyces sp. MS06]|uniref:hypothetical protein n=1 Tax=Streptomyces sp. MS06 TaxID=3385974 RepID=UPI0039A003AB
MPNQMTPPDVAGKDGTTPTMLALKTIEKDVSHLKEKLNVTTQWYGGLARMFTGSASAFNIASLTGATGVDFTAITLAKLGMPSLFDFSKVIEEKLLRDKMGLVRSKWGFLSRETREQIDVRTYAERLPADMRDVQQRLGQVEARAGRAEEAVGTLSRGHQAFAQRVVPRVENVEKAVGRLARGHQTIASAGARDAGRRSQTAASNAAAHPRNHPSAYLGRRYADEMRTTAENLARVRDEAARLANELSSGS